MPAVTTIKVTTATRDLVREVANEHGWTQSETIERAVRELAYRDWLTQVAAWEPDDEYLAELRQWNRADFGTPSERGDVEYRPTGSAQADAE